MSNFIRKDADNGVTFYHSKLIDCPHGFSTRIGGVSILQHTSSLNLNFNLGDDDNTVLENLRLFSEAVGVEPESIVSLPQIHSSDVIYVDENLRGARYYKTSQLKCDGYVTDRPGITLGVKTADCVPILYYDPIVKVIGAVHAGWRGTYANIAVNCVGEMVKLGASPENIRAAIGPSIHSCCYEVGEDFIDEVVSLAGREAAERYIGIPSDSKRPHADIVGYNVEILLDSGLKPENIDVCELCTCHNPELFYSHRFSKGMRGSMLSIISL